MFCLEKALLTRNTGLAAVKTVAKRKDKCTFIIPNNNGKGILCYRIFTLGNDAGSHILIYTDKARDKEGNMRMYASICVPGHDHTMKLLPLETEKMWTSLENVSKNLQQCLEEGIPCYDIVNISRQGPLKRFFVIAEDGQMDASIAFPRRCPSAVHRWNRVVPLRMPEPFANMGRTRFDSNGAYTYESLV